MSEKTKAQRLADEIDPLTRHNAPDHLSCKVAADELRRLDALNAALAEALEAIHGERSKQYHAFKLRDAREAGFSALAKAKEQTNE